MNNTEELQNQLCALGLGREEALVYLKLLEGPSTHLQLSRETKVNRTKVYRIIEQLEKRSLVTRRSDDRGVFLVAADPATLEVEIVTKEEAAKQQRLNFNQLLPILTQIQGQDTKAFVVRTYEGQAGLKQMCWHELKTRGELLSLGAGTIEQIVTDNRWATRHRDRQAAAGYKVRELINFDYKLKLPELVSKKIMTLGLYSYRVLSPELLQFDNQTIIYNDIVAIYHWRYDQKVGIEIISSTYAQMMRQLFNYYWQLAQPMT